MGKLFSKEKPKKQSNVTSHDRAVLQMKNSRDRLQKYQKRLEAVIEKETECAKALMKDGKKDKALLMLRKRKLQQGMLEKADTQLANIEYMIDSAEFAQLENKVTAAMKEGAATLKALQEEFTLEDVEKIMDDAADAIAFQQEVGELLAQSLTPDADQEAQEELKKLELEMLESQLPEVPDVPLPEVKKDPKTTTAVTTEEEPETRALAAA